MVYEPIDYGYYYVCRPCHLLNEDGATGGIYLCPREHKNLWEYHKSICKPGINKNSNVKLPCDCLCYESNGTWIHMDNCDVYYSDGSLRVNV